MSQVVITEIPAGQTLEMPCNNLQTVSFRTALGSAVVGNGGAVTGVLFVDHTLGTAAGPGTLNAPFLTLQQATTYAAVTLGLLEVLLQVAPGTYPEPLTIPSIDVAIAGWDPSDITITQVTGAITLTGGGAVSLIDIDYFGPQIKTSNDAAFDITVIMEGTTCSATITGANVSLVLTKSAQSGNVTAGAVLDLVTDGYSWARLMQLNPTLTPAAYTRTFLDAGHDVFTALLDTVAPVATNATVFVNVTAPAFVRENDRVQSQINIDGTTQFFTCGVHGVDAGLVRMWITNLGAPAIITQNILFTVHHMAMATEPAP